MSRLRTARRPAGFIEPCLPSPVARPPAGPGWIHEIKHDGFRMLVRRDRDHVRLFTRNGHDWTHRYPAIAISAGAVKATSFLIDGEAVVADAGGLASFDLLRSREHDRRAFVWAFDLLELDGEDLRPLPLDTRKGRLARLLACAPFGLAINDHHASDGPGLFATACGMAIEGIVSKRLDSRYESGRCRTWVKSKNPASAAALREASEDWNGRRRAG